MKQAGLIMRPFLAMCAICLVSGFFCSCDPHTEPSESPAPVPATQGPVSTNSPSPEELWVSSIHASCLDPAAVDAIYVDWLSIGEGATYRLLISSSSDMNGASEVGSLSGTSYLDSGSTSGIPSYYRVVATLNGKEYGTGGSIACGLRHSTWSESWEPNDVLAEATLLSPDQQKDACFFLLGTAVEPLVDEDWYALPITSLSAATFTVALKNGGNLDYAALRCCFYYKGAYYPVQQFNGTSLQMVFSSFGTVGQDEKLYLRLFADPAASVGKIGGYAVTASFSF